jgi:hypothetical protein
MIDRLTEFVRCHRMGINVEEANVMISMELLPVQLTDQNKWRKWYI